ncbi:hypothetical protein I317_06027 [Kwoniella heveanensis CBS 569]|nr:hypothetical protein I317_06027 [Kwoniella heveanensis CBS 569]
MTTYLSPTSPHSHSHSHAHPQHQHRAPRIFSNKENAPSLSPSPSVFELTDIDAISTSLRTSLSGVTPASHLSSSSSRAGKKPALGGLGIGRAPKFTYRKHSSKPYGRVTSVQRAKKAANANAAGKTNTTQQVRRSKKGLKSRPNPIKIVAWDAESISGSAAQAKALRGNMGVMDRVRLDRWRKSIWRPSASDISLVNAEAGSASGRGFALGQVRVPLMLPYPKFPPVPPVQNKALKDVPVQYIADRLAPLLPSISTITLAHRPYATVQNPNATNRTAPQASASSSCSTHPTLALAIPEVLDGSKPHWAEKTQGREPDMCLGIVKKGKEVEGAKMIVPVMSLVFATRCAYWPKLTTPPVNRNPNPNPIPNASSSSSSSSASIHRSVSSPQPQPQRAQPTPSEKAVSVLLPPIREERVDDEELASASSSASASETEIDVDVDANADASFSSDSSWASASESESDLDGSGGASALPRPIRDSRGFLHLPIVTLPLPSPETFGLIHRHLHHPQRAFIPDLLSIPESCTTRSSIIGALSDSSVQDLMGKLEVLQGVWQNLCTLGIGRLSTWRQLGEAWACVVGIIAGNGMLLRSVEEGESVSQGAAGSGMEVDGITQVGAAAEVSGARKKARTAAEDVAWEWVRRERKKMAEVQENL